ncbi:ATP-grasp fold amidoligase family protein [Providencia vermicola]|nr:MULTISPECIES: ATP-grasp fold amidoligase family protein [unclassified Providencia]
MKKFLKYKLRDTIRILLGKKGYTYLRFIIVHRYIPSFKKPRSFSEKIIYRKFNTTPSKFSKYVDKFTVREYIKNTIGENYLIPILKVKEKISPSDFIDLPNEFVIKTSNGGGGENILIVDDKSKFDILEICNKFNKYITSHMGKAIDEPFYDIERPHIIFEKLIKHHDGSYPSDYKIHIFNSQQSQSIFIQVDSDRFGNHKRSIYNEELLIQSFSIQPKYDEVGDKYIFPDNIAELIKLAKSLASQFKYVRVDMYNVDGKIYFGELTFCHGSGWEPISPKKADFMLGQLWDEYN